MRVYETAKYVVEKVAIPQTPGFSKDEFFVDDRTGKNHWVAKSLDEAKKWIHEQ